MFYRNNVCVSTQMVYFDNNNPFQIGIVCKISFINYCGNFVRYVYVRGFLELQ